MARASVLQALVGGTLVDLRTPEGLAHLALKRLRVRAGEDAKARAVYAALANFVQSWLGAHAKAGLKGNRKSKHWSG